MTTNLPVDLYDLGNMAYRDALDWQQAKAAEVRAEISADALALLEHPPVYTMGARGGDDHMLLSEDDLRERGADLIVTDRGGDMTFHGPGQLVLYAVLNLRRRSLRPVDHVRCLERTILETLSALGLRGGTVKGRPGVWIGSRKIAAIGVSIRGGATMHGAALNVTNDLTWFNAIVPCGIHGLGVTSMARELENAPPMDCVLDAAVAAFSEAYEANVRPAAPLVEPVCGL
ncbi:MAG: lipoyl(octanoyl) transferase LipB [Chloroflexota bacterium]|nr:lipoyl(octanoyl) transferase LipB [Chloroflexota bacterium]